MRYQNGFFFSGRPMVFAGFLPWEYGVRNLFRRPLRTGLTWLGLSTSCLLILVVVGFIRGLEKTLTVSGEEDVAIVLALGMGENIEYSSIPMRTSDLLRAEVDEIRRRRGRAYVSPELYLGTQIRVEDEPEETLGLVRGVTHSVLLVRRQVSILSGTWPGPNEIIVGRLAAAKLGAENSQLAIGKSIELEGRRWTISGLFSAGGSVFESELWCRLDDLQQAMKRQDLSIVAVTCQSEIDVRQVSAFCKRRLDLELQSMRETDYYGTLQSDYGPVRMLAWLMVVLVAGAGVFAGLNTMYGAALGRIREMATLQTLGFGRLAIMVSLVQEGLLLGMAAAITATLFAMVFVHGLAVRFTMGAFQLNIDSIAILVGCGTGMMLGFIGALPPAWRALSFPIADGLKAI
jgi:ABC-type lipoprotein release transport system permease subunit